MADRRGLCFDTGHSPPLRPYKTPRGRTCSLIQRIYAPHITACSHGQARPTRGLGGVCLVFLDPRDRHAPGENFRARRGAAWAAGRVRLGACDGTYRHAFEALILTGHPDPHDRASLPPLLCDRQRLGLGHRHVAFGRDFPRSHGQCAWNHKIARARAERP